MAKIPPRSHAWIFVSHASNDLARVREVRNYLEAKGASPLLFHLLALDKPEQFWPIIEQEIHARNFFLYCESAAAAASEWVDRERAAVAAVAKRRAIRIGSVRVDERNLDLSQLESFLRVTRVFASYTRADAGRVAPFLTALDEAGFSVFRDQSILGGTNWHDAVMDAITDASRDGWVLIFVSRAALQSEAVSRELHVAHQLGARCVPVLLEPVELEMVGPHLRALQFFDAASDPETAPARLVSELLQRPA